MEQIGQQNREKIWLIAISSILSCKLQYLDMLSSSIIIENQ